MQWENALIQRVVDNAMIVVDQCHFLKHFLKCYFLQLNICNGSFELFLLIISHELNTLLHL